MLQTHRLLRPGSMTAFPRLWAQCPSGSGAVLGAGARPVCCVEAQGEPPTLLPNEAEVPGLSQVQHYR